MNDIVEKALRELARAKKVLRPDDVVTAAQPEDSPLHAYFTWDDTEAAKKWRLEEARALIRSVRIEVTYENNILRVPAYLKDPDVPGDEQGYREIRKMTDREKQQEALLYELERATGALERAMSIASYFGIREKLEEIRTRIQDVRNLKMAAGL